MKTQSGFFDWVQDEGSPSMCNREMENVPLCVELLLLVEYKPRTLLRNMDVGLGTIKWQEDMVTFLKLLQFKLRKLEKD